MVKRVAAIILMLCTVICLSACGTSDYYLDSSSSSTSKSESSKAVSSLEESKTGTASSKPKTSATNSVNVLSKNETTANLVWVPTNGGKKYHAKSSCSNMKNPKQVSKENAIADGFGACGRCY